MQFDASNVSIRDWIIMGIAVLLFIFSFFGWRTYSAGTIFGASISYSVGAWHEYWWIATLLGLAVGAVVAMRALFSQPLPQIKPVFLFYAAAGGFVITFIALIENFVRSYGGPGFGIWASLILAAGQTYLVWLWAQDQPGWSLPKVPGPKL